VAKGAAIASIFAPSGAIFFDGLSNGCQTG